MLAHPLRPRPKLTIQRMVLEFVSFFFLFLSGWVTLFRWKRLPQSIPVHFGIDGEPTRWGSRWWALALPVVAAVTYFTLSWIRRSPHRFNYPWTITPENAARQYHIAQSLLDWFKAELALVFFALQWQMLRVALGKESTLHQLFLPVAGALLIGTIVLHMIFAQQKR